MGNKIILIQVKPVIDNPNAWYRHFPKQQFEAFPIRGGYRLAHDTGEIIRCINAEDCEVVK